MWTSHTKFYVRFDRIRVGLTRQTPVDQLELTSRDRPSKSTLHQPCFHNSFLSYWKILRNELKIIINNNENGIFLLINPRRWWKRKKWKWAASSSYDGRRFGGWRQFSKLFNVSKSIKQKKKMKTRRESHTAHATICEADKLIFVFASLLPSPITRRVINFILPRE